MGSAAGEGKAPSYDIAVLKGDGVGPDVVDEAGGYPRLLSTPAGLI